MLAIYSMLIEIRNGVRTNPTGRGMIPRIMRLKCDVCDVEYERPYSKIYIEEKINRCSHKCALASRPDRGVGTHGAKVVDVSCSTCKASWQVVENVSKRKWGHFCDRKCYAEFRSANSHLFTKSTSLLHTTEAKAKAKEVRKHNTTLPGYVHHRIGKTHTDETKELISEHHKTTGCLSGAKNGMFGRKHTEETRVLMSDAKAKAILEGTFKSNSTHTKQGMYASSKSGKTFRYRSGWELAVMKYLDESEHVKTWDYESIKIAFMYKEHKRWYIPDFFVTFIDEHNELWEVKPKEYVNAKKNTAKASAARTWCLENNVIEFRFLTGDHLREMKIIK